jgi:hypothetical protein
LPGGQGIRDGDEVIWFVVQGADGSWIGDQAVHDPLRIGCINRQPYL